jgi:hypothetical protein
VNEIYLSFIFCILAESAVVIDSLLSLFISLYMGIDGLRGVSRCCEGTEAFRIM